MRIEEFHIKNYRALRDVHLKDIPPMSVFVGANGTGKSTLFDAFGFLQDALATNVTKALNKRGGFKEVISRGEENFLGIETKAKNPKINHSIKISSLKNKQPIVQEENFGDGNVSLHFKEGKFKVLASLEGHPIQRGDVRKKFFENVKELSSPDILALKALTQFSFLNNAIIFNRAIEKFFISDIDVNLMRETSSNDRENQLFSNGENLASVALNLYENHSEIFQEILKKMARYIPGVSSVKAEATKDHRVLLEFQDGSFKDPFLSRHVSDGTLKMFAYLVLLHDPKPHPLLCVEEPENYLYPHLLRELAEEFRDYTFRGGQVFVSTHSPDFLNGVELDEIFWLEKKDGFTSVFRAGESELLRNLVKEGDLPGALWKQGFFNSETAFPCD